MAARGRVAKASRMLDGVFRLWSEQLDLVAESGADLDAGAMWRALETEIGPREEVMAASALLGELIGSAGADRGGGQEQRGGQPVVGVAGSFVFEVVGQRGAGVGGEVHVPGGAALAPHSADLRLFRCPQLGRAVRGELVSVRQPDDVPDAGCPGLARSPWPSCP